jgi:hypothetical protein
MPVLVIRTEIVRPPCVSVHTDEKGEKIYIFLDGQPDWYTTETFYVEENSCLKTAVPPRHKIQSLLPNHSKNKHPYPRAAQKVPKNQHRHKGR